VSEIALGSTDGRPAVSGCPACDAEMRVPAFVAGDWDDRAWEARWSYVRCTSCGTVYADPQPSSCELERAYDRSYAPYAPASGVLTLLSRPLVMKEARSLVAAAPAGSLAVDVGCGAGLMLGRLRDAGWTGPMQGIEPQPQVAHEAAERLGVPVHVSSVEELPPDLPPVGLLVLRHVVEHVRDPFAVLHALRALLAPDGVIYVATPDARSLAAHAFGCYWHGWDPPRHVSVMPSGAVRTLLRRAGLEVLWERWDWAPQMWTGSLQHRLGAGRWAARAHLLSSPLNPLVGVPAAIAATVELLLRRTTMYGVLARPARGD
jgi:SAM-dependent methyltransferase